MSIHESKHIIQTLVGQQITRVSIEPCSVSLLFNNAEIYIESGWKLKAPDGSLLDRDQKITERKSFELWRITGHSVIGVEFTDQLLPDFVLQIDNKSSLEINSSNDGMEDWSLVTPSTKVYCNGETVTVFSI